MTEAIKVKGKFRSSASFGRRMEYFVLAELLKRNYDVYMTVIDDQQIDCVIRLDEDTPRYLDIQIKARSDTAKYAGHFSAMEIRKPRTNFFFIFYCDGVTYEGRKGACWVIPSEALHNLGTTNKEGKHSGKVSIVLANQYADGQFYPRPKFKAYLNNFDQLKSHAQTH